MAAFGTAIAWIVLGYLLIGIFGLNFIQLCKRQRRESCTIQSIIYLDSREFHLTGKMDTSIRSFLLENSSVRRLPKVFKFLPRLVEYSAPGCRIERVTRNDFFGANYLRILNLTRNDIIQLPSMIFAEIPILERVSISHNQISEITLYTFVNAHRMKYLDLDHNQISSFPEIALAPLWNLKKLKMLDRNMRSVRHQTFLFNSHLKIVLLNNNSIGHLDDFILSFVTDVDIDDLSYNDVLKIYMANLLWFRGMEANFCDKITSASKLDLDGSFLRTINVEYKRTVRELSVSDNFRKQIEKLFGFRYLVTRDISLNSSKRTDTMTFVHLPELLELRIRRIGTILRYGLFRGLAELKLLNLSKINLKSINLTEIYAMNNQEQYFEIKTAYSHMFSTRFWLYTKKGQIILGLTFTIVFIILSVCYCIERSRRLILPETAREQDPVQQQQPLQFLEVLDQDLPPDEEEELLFQEIERLEREVRELEIRAIILQQEEQEQFLLLPEELRRNGENDWVLLNWYPRLTRRG